MAALGANNISITDVHNILGHPNYDLGSIVAKAKSGGAGGYAFQIKENGYSTTSLGYLINGASPYWNIWSKNSAGHFENYQSSETLRYRLNSNVSDTVNAYYRYSLGDFRNYNHTAPAPSVNCTNAVNGTIQYYQSTNKVQIIYTVMTSEINWSQYLNVNHFYLRIVGITSSGGESELAFIESPSYVNTTGGTTSYNDRYELQNFSIYGNIRLELWVGYNSGASGITNRARIPFIATQTIKLQQMAEGVNAGNIIWFYIYNTSTAIEDIAIPDYQYKIPVTNKKMEFNYSSGTPNNGTYRYTFSARVTGDTYTEITNYGNQLITGNYEVLGQGMCYKYGGGTVQMDYQSLGTIYLDSSINTYYINLPESFANNRYDTGVVHLFIRKYSNKPYALEGIGEYSEQPATLELNDGDIEMMVDVLPPIEPTA